MNHKEDAEWLELVSSLLFLRRYDKLYGGALKEQLIEKKIGKSVLCALAEYNS